MLSPRVTVGEMFMLFLAVTLIVIILVYIVWRQGLTVCSLDCLELCLEQAGFELRTLPASTS